MYKKRKTNETRTITNKQYLQKVKEKWSRMNILIIVEQLLDLFN